MASIVVGPGVVPLGLDPNDTMITQLRARGPRTPIGHFTPRPRLGPAVLGLLSLATVGCKAPDLPEHTATVATLGPERAEHPVLLGPNDLLRVGVHGHPELSTPVLGNQPGVRVGPEGSLHLPLIGAVPVEGVTLMEARARIAEALTEYMHEPKVDVTVVEYGARRFYLFGEVMEPGPQVLDRSLTLYQALSMGGGFKRGADREEIVLLRGETADDLEVHVFDAENPDPTGLCRIEPDDLIFVRRTGAGRFSEEVLPVLQGISSSLSSVATVLLIEDRLGD